MGSAAGKERDPDRDTWSDPVQEISINADPFAKSSKTRTSSFARREDMSAVHKSQNDVSNPSRDTAVVNNTSVPSKNGRETKADVAKEKRYEDTPMPRVWREHKPLDCSASQKKTGTYKSRGNGGSASSFCRSSIQGNTGSPRKRFEDIPVSSMWREASTLPGCTDSDENKDPVKRFITRERTRRETDDSIKKGIEEIERNFREGQNAEIKRPWSYNHVLNSVGVSQKSNVLNKEPLLLEPTRKQDLHRGRSSDTGSHFSLLPRTMSDPLGKPMQHQNRASGLAANSGVVEDKVHGTSRLISRTYSDPVKSTTEPCRRPATPCVSTWMSNHRQLNDYIGQRRANECCARSGPPLSSGRDQKWLGTIADVEEPEKRSPPSPSQRRCRNNLDFPSFFSF